MSFFPTLRTHVRPMKRSRTPSFSDDVQGDTAQSQSEKYTHVDADVSQVDLISCHLPPHKPLSFDSYDAYERHYQQSHVNRCIDCRKNFPTELYLDRHIAENHDPFTAARRDRGEKIYGCFVDDCDKVCATWQKRKLHLIDKHGFPKDFDFFIVNDGVDGRTSLLRSSRKQPTKSAGTTKSGTRAQQDDAEDVLTGPMRSLNIVPSRIRFGGKKHLPDTLP